MNPALPALMENTMSAAVSYGFWSPSLLCEHRISAAFAFKVFDKFALSAALSKDIQPSIDGESFHPGNNLFGVGVAYAPIKNLSIGASFHYAQQLLLEDYTISGVSFDAIVQYSGKHYNLAGGVVSIGPNVSSEKSGYYSLPTSVKIAGDVSFPLAESVDCDFAFDGDYYFSGNYALSCGVTADFLDKYFVRVGGRVANNSCALPGHVALGAGINFGPVTLDVSYIAFNTVLQNSAMIGVSVNL